jgi:16S rRNA (cytosine1402-N4)-methyltransferase
VPVLLAEVVDWLAPVSGGRYVDGTLGGGGHAEAILEASSPDGRLLGLDADPAAVERVGARLERFGDRATLVQANFRELERVARAHDCVPTQGALLDLGLSSYQLGEAERGFSFRGEQPLDMRFDPALPESAADVLNTWPESDLADVFYQYGEERRSRRLARVAVERRVARPFRTTTDLVEAVTRALGPKRGRIHPATRIFQALRIAVNDELGALRDGLRGAAAILAPGGRLAVISFHSLEDRLVKQFFRDGDPDEGVRPLRPLTPKPLVASDAELAANPRARSAKLRVAERI